jgi:hypothetical protein
MDFDNVLDVIKKGLKDGAALSMEKIEEVSRIGKLKIEEFSAKRKIERNFIDMGERVYELITDGNGKDTENDILIKSAIDNVKKLYIELDEIAEKIDEESAKKDHTGDTSDSDEEVTGIY